MPILEGCVFFTQKNQGFQAFKFPRQKLLLDFSCRLFGYPPDFQQNTTLILNLAVKTPTKMNNSQRQHQQKLMFIFFNQVVLEITTTNTKKKSSQPNPNPVGGTSTGHHFCIYFSCSEGKEGIGERHLPTPVIWVQNLPKKRGRNGVRRPLRGKMCVNPSKYVSFMWAGNNVSPLRSFSGNK